MARGILRSSQMARFLRSSPGGTRTTADQSGTRAASFIPWRLLLSARGLAGCV